MNKIKFKLYAKDVNGVWDCIQREDCLVDAFGNLIIIDDNGNSLPNPFVDGSYCLCISTGLVDKNGVEIYEGDILKADRGVLDFNGRFKKIDEWGYTFFQVNIENGCVLFRSGIEAIPMFKSIGKRTVYVEIANVSEIAGNIYQNKELLQ